MLRRKLLVVFGLVVTLMLLMGVGAVWTLQQLLGGLHHVETESWTVTDNVNELAITISVVELELHRIETRKQTHLDRLLDGLETMQTQLAAIENRYVSHLPETDELTGRIQTRMGDFTTYVTSLATTPDETWSARNRNDAIQAAIELRQDILLLSRAVRQHGDAEQKAIMSRFRATVLILAVAFILVINLSVIALMKIASMVVKPVDELVEATEELAAGRFDHRIELQQRDEFDVLANAFNTLGERLEANEKRKLETVQQLAIALNHELNNVAGMISLQIQLIGRQAGGNPLLEKYTRQIQDSLARMNRTLEALKHLRRIVLTEYTQGVQMLDIERSAADGAAEGSSDGSEHPISAGR